MPQRPRVVSVEAVDLVVEGGERLLLYGLHGYLVRAAAQLREGRPALAAFLQRRPVLEMPDVGHRLLRHALDLALLLARAVGLDREDAVHLGAQAHVLQDPGGEGLVAELAQLAHHLDGLGARRCRERAQVLLGVLRRRARRRAQLQLGVKRGHQREELQQLLVRAGPEVVDHAGQARGEDVHAVHEPQRAPAHLQCRHFSPDLQRTRRQRWL